MTKPRCLFVALACLLAGSATAFVSTGTRRVSSAGASGFSLPVIVKGTPKCTSSSSSTSSSWFQLHQARESSSALGAVATDAEEDNLLPSIFFLASAASLVKLFFVLQDSGLPATPGYWALLWTTVAVAWDNFVIGLGKPFFPDVRTNDQQFNILKALSYPRFTAHAVFVPFLYATTAEIGQATGIGWLQDESVQTLVLAAAAIVGTISRLRFVDSEGIQLDDYKDSPPNALERSLIWFTYVKPEALYILPAVLLAIFNLVVGVQSYRMGDDFTEASIWLIVSAVAVLVGNAKPQYVTRFTGNLAEVVMLWCIYESSMLVFT